MAKFKIDVKVKDKQKKEIKSIAKSKYELNKKEDVYNILVWELLEGLPSGRYSFVWDIKPD